VLSLSQSFITYSFVFIDDCISLNKIKHWEKFNIIAE